MIYKINAESLCFREVNTKVSDVESDGMKAFISDLQMEEIVQIR